MNKERFKLDKVAPDAYKAMLKLESYNNTSLLDLKTAELIKIRASQINHCAFCLDMHTETAMALGEDARRIFALSAWHESHLFTEKERAVLQLTEEVTNIKEQGVRDETYRDVEDFFGEEVAAQILMNIVTINAWNRISITAKSIYKE